MTFLNSQRVSNLMDDINPRPLSYNNHSSCEHAMDVHAAALNGDADIIRRYISDGGDPNLVNEAGITPLHSAAVQGRGHVIRLLVAAGADTDLKVSREKGQASHDASPLHLAVLGGSQDATEALLEAGAKVGAKNSKGLTPLHVSCLKPNVSIVRLLLLWGADTNARDRKRRTPEQVIGRLGGDAAEKDTVRAVLRGAVDAKKAALAHSETPPLETTDTPTVGTCDTTVGCDARRADATQTVDSKSYGGLLLPPTPPTIDAPTSAIKATMVGAPQTPSGPTNIASVAAGPATPSQIPGASEKNPLPVALPPPIPTLSAARAASEGSHSIVARESAAAPPSKATTAARSEGRSTPVIASTSVAPERLPTNIMQAATDHCSSQVAAGEDPTCPVLPGKTEMTQIFHCGSIVGGEYELVKRLPPSSGSSELWHACKIFTGERIVIKRIVQGGCAAFDRERTILKFLQQRGLGGDGHHSIPLMGVLSGLRCLVLAQGGRNLRQIGQKLYERCAGNAAGYMDRVRPYARQIVEICQWLHRLGITWGDVKPENFVEGQDGDLRAVDFDSAGAIGGGPASRDAEVLAFVGSSHEADHVLTPRYCAPERMRACANCESFPATKTCDVWSVGMVLYWLFTGQDYFSHGMAETEIAAKLCSPGFTVCLAGVDRKQDQAKSMLGTMLSVEPMRRGSMDSVLGRAFFAGGASISAASLQMDMAASVDGLSQRLEATVRSEGSSTRLLFDEKMARWESHANEMLTKFGRMDRMLESLVGDSIDCPHLFLLTPLEGSTKIWKPETWFSDFNRLTVLCAHDFAPVGDGFKVPCPRSVLEKWAPAIQASAFVLKLGCKAACMTSRVSPTTVDGMSAALGVNILAGQKVSAALRSAAGKALSGADATRETREVTGAGREPTVAACSDQDGVEEGRRLTGEAYEALVAFLDAHDPTWRATLKQSMVKAVRGDGQVSWTCHQHAKAWTLSGSPPRDGDDSDAGVRGTSLLADEQRPLGPAPRGPLTGPSKTKSGSGSDISAGATSGKRLGIFARFKGRFRCRGAPTTTSSSDVGGRMVDDRAG